MQVNQFEIQLNKVYELKRYGNKFDNGEFSIFIRGNGTVKVYTAERSNTTSKNDMQLEHEGIIGHKSFLVIPRFIYFEIDEGTIDELILTGIQPTEIGV